MVPRHHLSHRWVCGTPGMPLAGFWPSACTHHCTPLGSACASLHKPTPPARCAALSHSCTNPFVRLDANCCRRTAVRRRRRPGGALRLCGGGHVDLQVCRRNRGPAPVPGPPQVGRPARSPLQPRRRALPQRAAVLLGALGRAPRRWPQAPLLVRAAAPWVGASLLRACLPWARPPLMRACLPAGTVPCSHADPAILGVTVLAWGNSLMVRAAPMSALAGTLLVPRLLLAGSASAFQRAGCHPVRLPVSVQP